jgi:hypothetical protein
MMPELQQRIFEVHPEVCFWKLAGRPLANSKRKAAGFEERWTLLSAAFSGVHIPERREARQFGARRMTYWTQPWHCGQPSAPCAETHNVFRLNRRLLPGP